MYKNTISFDLTIEVYSRHRPSGDNPKTVMYMITTPGTGTIYTEAWWSERYQRWDDNAPTLDALLTKELHKEVLQKLCKGRKKNKLTYKVTIEPQA